MPRDLGKYFGALMMFAFGMLAFVRWTQGHMLFYLLLMLRDFTAAFFFIKRVEAIAKASRRDSILAYISSAMPLIYLPASVSNPLLLTLSSISAILGFLVVILATIELGTSIGISPANRKHISSGIYRYVNHPMYIGYVISEFGQILINPINTFLLILSCCLYFLRSRLENIYLNISSDRRFL